MLTAIKESLDEVRKTDQETDQVKGVLRKLSKLTLSTSELMKALDLPHRPTFRNNYLHPAMDLGLVEMTFPNKPNSRVQRYRITAKGIAVLKG